MKAIKNLLVLLFSDIKTYLAWCVYVLNLYHLKKKKGRCNTGSAVKVLEEQM